MKEKLLMLILGILIGAILTAGGFLLLGNKNRTPEGMNRRDREGSMENRVPGDMPQGMPENGMGTPPNETINTEENNG